MENINCRNCGTLVTGNFCTECGQKRQKRVSLKTLASDIYNAALDFESPFLKTLITLTINPGKLYREYLDGARKRYFSPIRYSLWIMTFAIAIAGFVGAKIFPDISVPPDQPELIALIDGYYKFLNAIIIPLTFVYAFWMAIFARLAFRGEKYSKEELFIPMLLNGSHLYIIWIPAVILGDVGNVTQQLIYMLISMAYMAWGLAETYQPRTKKNYLKSIAIVALGQITFTALFALVSGLGFFLVGVYMGFTQQV